MMGFAERGTVAEARYYRGIIPGQDEERFWVRIKLQHPKEDMSAWLEYHVSTGTGEFIVDSKRFDEAMAHNWRPGDRCQMFWQDTDDPTDGEWYGGTVVSCTSVKCVRNVCTCARNTCGYNRQRRKPGTVTCPWNTITVKWDPDPDTPGAVPTVTTVNVEIHEPGGQRRRGGQGQGGGRERTLDERDDEPCERG